MTPKEALNKLDNLAQWYESDVVGRGYEEAKRNREELTRTIDQALTSYDELVKEHELTIKLFNSANEQLNELEHDVKRFMELYNPPQPDDEYDILRVKLSKVGKEE